MPTPAPVAQNSPVAAFRGSVSANTYDYGYCTWYVKNKRPDIGGYWGDANKWLGSAIAAGYTTGSTPVPGAIAVSGESQWGHVAYVESVGNGTVTVSEMNYKGWGIVSTRTVSSSFFTYIY